MVYMSRIAKILTAEDAKLARLLDDLVECHILPMESDEMAFKYMESLGEEINCSGLI